MYACLDTQDYSASILLIQFLGWECAHWDGHAQESSKWAEQLVTYRYWSIFLFLSQLALCAARSGGHSVTHKINIPLSAARLWGWEPGGRGCIYYCCLLIVELHCCFLPEYWILKHLWGLGIHKYLDHFKHYKNAKHMNRKKTTHKTHREIVSLQIMTYHFWPCL